MKYNSVSEQITLNVNRVQAMVAEGVKTQQARLLVYILTGKKLSAHELVTLARSNHPDLPYSLGKLTLRPSSKEKEGRYWLWDVIFAPAGYLVS